MARLPRYTTPGQPQHVIQRGNNKTPLFVREEDYRVFRHCLLSAITRFECEIHAYVFMTNHVHLLVSTRDARGISKTMQSVGRQYVRYFNDRSGRTGTLWEGRYRATVIDTDEYLFTCCRYIEENPVRAAIVPHPSRFAWSSYLANALGVDDALVTPHERYLALGRSPGSRRAAYRALFRGSLEAPALTAIRDATNHAWALGDDRYRRKVSESGRRAAPLPPGCRALASRQRPSMGV
jgi:putative transposase